MRWLISDIFKNLREINIEISVKFDNINYLEIKNDILFIKENNIFDDNEKILLNNIFKKYLNIRDTKFINEHFKILYPYPVLNSKFNNFITKILIINDNIQLEFFQKDNKKYFETVTFKYNHIDNLLSFLKSFTNNKINLLKKLYRYNQIIIPFSSFENSIDLINKKWQSYIDKNKISKYIDNIYFYI